MTDPYTVLGVAKTASDDDIRKAFRKLAKKHHPDLNPGDKAAEAKFKEISQANEILSDAEKRRRFDAGEIDATGQEVPPRGFYRDQAGGMGGAKYERGGAHESFVDMGGIFSEMFGQRGGQRGGGFAFGDGEGFDMGGLPVTYSLRVPFLVAARGGKQRVNLPDGKTLDIDIPEGATNGQTLRLKGQGMPGTKGRPAGDAYVEIHRRPACLLRGARQRHPCRAAGDADRGGAGWPDPRADDWRARYAGCPGGLQHGHIAPPQGPRPARSQVETARRPVRQAQGRIA